jgi:peptidoglycan/LPS O-acetylase OafA/YrhL
MPAYTIANIQVLRALAAYMVVYHHVQDWFNGFHPNTLTSNIGATGVDIFFVISGFVMVYTNQTVQRTPIEFWRGRIIRIVPLYWLVTLLIAWLSLIGLKPYALANGWTGTDLLTSLFFVAHIRSDGQEIPIVFLGWTLVYEMFFYAVFGVALALSNMQRIVLAMTGFFIVLWVFGMVVGPATFTLKYYTNPIMLEFSAGSVLGLLYSRPMLFQSRFYLLFGVLTIVIGFLSICVGDLLMGGASSALRHVVVGIPATSIVMGTLALERAGIRCGSSFLLLQGAASYCVYLLHPLVLQATFKVMKALLPLKVPLFAVGTVLVAFVSVAAVAALVHTWLEKPLSAYLRRRWRSPQAHVAKATTSQPQ